MNEQENDGLENVQGVHVKADREQDALVMRIEYGLGSSMSFLLTKDNADKLKNLLDLRLKSLGAS